MTGQIQLIVIHDNPLKVSGMLQHLKAEDYSITYASSGAEGMNLAKKANPDIILVDAALPDAGGPDICRQIKSVPSLSQCFVILLDSTLILSDEKAEGLEAVVDSHIAGPISNLEFAARIQGMLQINSARNALKACEERFRLLCEKSPVSYLTLNENGCVQSINPACENLFGCMKPDMLGASIYDMLAPSDADNLRAYLSSVNSLERTQDLKLSVRRKDGSVARIMFSGFRETNTRNKTFAIFCILYDVTDKLKNQSDMLKAQQLEFTATLAGGIAHDFNNLLMAIMGNISLAQLFLNPEDKATKILEKAESTCNQANELTQQFIILSKCGYPSKRPSSILKLLKESSLIGIPSPKVDVVLNMPDHIWGVEVDEHQIRYAFTHLMTNAVEAMPGGGKIHVTIRNIVASSDSPLPAHPISPGNYLHLMIKDQGQGISSEHLPRIFDPYYTTKELGPKKGMGLGLTTVYSIVHKHDGFIFIESEVNQGTTVDIYLPALPDNGSNA
jgi:PAS domain S-box-containing protein